MRKVLKLTNLTSSAINATSSKSSFGEPYHVEGRYSKVRLFPIHIHPLALYICDDNIIIGAVLSTPSGLRRSIITHGTFSDLLVTQLSSRSFIHC